jgi:phosphonate transport system permease protein
MAAVAVGFSILPGLIFGFLGSTAWWSENLPGSSNALQRLWRRALAPTLYVISRVFITFTRSIHELIWATLFLAAIGRSPLVAVIALAIPYSGTLARVFSELIDEVSRDTVKAYQGIGASPAQVYLLGLVPRAFPDLLSYAFYRFECGLRSAAVLGFVGVETVGYYLKLSFENAHYGEVWTYLYALLIVIVLFDMWCGAMRERLQTRAF